MVWAEQAPGVTEVHLFCHEGTQKMGAWGEIGSFLAQCSIHMHSPTGGVQSSCSDIRNERSGAQGELETLWQGVW